MTICVVIRTLLFSLSTLCIEEYCHMQWTLIEAVRVLCYSLCVCRLQRTHCLKAIYEWSEDTEVYQIGGIC